MNKKRKDWLSRRDRIEIARLAATWVGSPRKYKNPARKFAAACIVIEHYLAHGGSAALELHTKKKRKKAKLRVVVPFKKGEA